MLRFSSLVVVCFIAVPTCHAFSLFDDAFLLSGPCPKKTGVTNFKDVPLDGKWYTHWVVGQYSPWNYLQCHTRTISASYSASPQKIITRSKFPLEFQFPFFNKLLEFTGFFDNPNDIGQYHISYYYRYLIYYGTIDENMTFLYTHPDGAALVSSCIEYKEFHFESVFFMTKSSDPADSLISADANAQAQKIVEELKIPGKSATKIDQIDCAGIH